MIYLFLAASTWPLTISELPSPTVIVDSIVLGHQATYGRDLKRTSTFISKYLALPKKDRCKLITNWVQESAVERKETRKNLDISGKNDRDILIAEDKANLDLVKLDILLIAENRTPIFHTRFWLECVYQTSDQDEATFVIPERITRLPSMFTSFSGRIKEPAKPSFDPFYDEESAMVESWVKSGLDCRLLKPMTVDKMTKKLKGTRKSGIN